MASVQTPLISVITPLYNSAEYLDGCVESVLGQTYANLELILVDDGSTDASGAMCDAFAARDRRVRVVHQPNGGVCAARNAGLRVAQGDYIAWLDSDDRYDPAMLETLMRAIQSHGADIAVCNYWNITGDKRELRYPTITRNRLYSREEFVPYILSRIASPVLWSTLMPRALYDGIEFPEGLTFEDIRVTHRLYERGASVALIAEPLVFRRHRDDSLSRVQNVALRIDNMRGYIERCQYAQAHWPQCRRSALVGAARMLPVLRGFLLRAPHEEFARHRAELLEIYGFFRANRRELLSGCKSLSRRLVYAFEFDCMTSGSRTLLALSQAFDNLIRRPKSCLWHMPTPDLPPFAT